jgi:hypothetical protein
MEPYTVEMEIDLPREQVIELFDNPDNMYKWLKGLQSFELISGDPGQPGARSKMVYLNGKRQFEMTEIVTRNDLPDAMDGRYEWAGGQNTVHNRFVILGPDKTMWKSTCNYQCTSLLMKVIGAFFPGVFRKQSLSAMQSFKAFCEEGRDVRESA